MGARKFYLREWRQFRGLSQDRLAEIVDTSKGYLSQMERGERPWSQRWLESLARALDIAPEDLITTPPPAVADADRAFGADAPPPATARFDARMMAECVAAAFRIIAPRRDLSTGEAVERAAQDVAEAAIGQYLAYYRLVDEETKPAA